jgi:hypothetical protein
MCILQILGEAASQLLEGATEHKDHKLSKWIPWPDNTRKHLPDCTQGNSRAGNGLNNNPRDSKHRADCNDDEDRPPRRFRWPRSYGDNRDDETECEENRVLSRDIELARRKYNMLRELITESKVGIKNWDDREVKREELLTHHSGTSL